MGSKAIDKARLDQRLPRACDGAALPATRSQIKLFAIHSTKTGASLPAPPYRRVGCTSSAKLRQMDG